MKSLGAIFFAMIFFSMMFFVGGYDSKIGTFINDNSMPASIFFTQSTTSVGLRDTFDTASSTKKKLNVLIVPGHEPDFGGTEYLSVKERDINADLALYLAQYLVEDGHYRVTMTRGKDGWNPDFQDYFTMHDDEIKTFVRAQKMEMVRLVDEGRVTKVTDSVPHNDAPSDVALRLFGINKWANEHHADIVIHVHFNDSAPRRVDSPGEHNGFTIYVPERQYSNAQASADIAQNVFKRLSKMFPVSSLPQEDKGIVEDQDLIAVGSSNTVDAASMLVEYGYIYEPQFKIPIVRALVLKELAFQTYLGLADFFGETSLIVGPYQSTLLPYDWGTPVKKTRSANRGVLAFQAALSDRGFYPPQYYTRNECPISGLFGSCTRTALSAFQREFEIKNEQDVIGAKTRAQLRKLFEPSLVGVQ
ncbi:MAG: N-acetylmuramoyl-L-alanine amidase [Candidatus Yonathbacteria bacterium]|nr:N-acetylmuramoyl-L-alanine amidase [Candidatus Yonathbacteria bacterium]